MPKDDWSPNDEAAIRSLDGESPLAQALTGGEPQRVGWFRLYFDDEHWEWSPEVERIHGYEPAPCSRPPLWCCRTNIQRTMNR